MYKFTAKEKIYAINALSMSSIRIVCRRYKINRSTLWRWRKQYDGTVQSLAPKFSRKGIHLPMIEEASRKRFIYAYKEQIQDSTVDFVLRAFKFFGYKPKTIQTDNGWEFTFLGGKTKNGRIHKFDMLCNFFQIKHQLIRPRTPRHNGKVERSHRNDNERFYRYLHYYSFDDLQKQMAAYLKRSNDIPTSVLRSKNNNRRWLSPNEKELELKQTL